jgi:hypothetical protein
MPDDTEMDSAVDMPAEITLGFPAPVDLPQRLDSVCGFFSDTDEADEETVLAMKRDGGSEVEEVEEVVVDLDNDNAASVSPALGDEDVDEVEGDVCFVDMDGDHIRFSRGPRGSLECCVNSGSAIRIRALRVDGRSFVMNDCSGSGVMGCCTVPGGQEKVLKRVMALSAVCPARATCATVAGDGDESAALALSRAETEEEVATTEVSPSSRSFGLLGPWTSRIDEHPSHLQRSEGREACEGKEACEGEEDWCDSMREDGKDT